MFILFHLTRGDEWSEVSHEENLAFAESFTAAHGGRALAVTLTECPNTGEVDPPFETRVIPERAVVVDTTLRALASLTSDRDVVAHLLAASRWQQSSVGTITHRLYVSDPNDDASSSRLG